MSETKRLAEADLWRKAASLAAKAHGRQLRRDGATPYFAHPVRVALTVRHIFGLDDAAALAAALLHDTIEDTTVDRDDIDKQFGPEVADLVVALTKDMRLAKPRREPAYDEQLAKADWRARLIKLADVMDNLCDRATRPGRFNVEKEFRKCERAIALARQDAERWPATARAIEALQAEMARQGQLVENHEKQ